MTKPNATELLARLERIVKTYGPTLTAFSGGVDSTLVAVIANRVHGEKSLAMTGISASLALDEQTHASQIARELGIRHRTIDTRELDNADYRANSGDRCFHCKSELFHRLREVATQERFETIVSGDNLDDLQGHRPGLQAATDYDVRKPLVEAEFGKIEIRLLAEYLSIPNHAKPASPCLASRIPAGTEVSPEILRQIDIAETAVRNRGFQICRVRHHGTVARIELPAKDLQRALDVRGDIITDVKRAGYSFVALDLGGFRSGSLNVLHSI